MTKRGKPLGNMVKLVVLTKKLYISHSGSLKKGFFLLVRSPPKEGDKNDHIMTSDKNIFEILNRIIEKKIRQDEENQI